MNTENVEDIYPVTPLQHGLLFHAVMAPRAGLYLSQSAHTLRGVDAGALRRSWQLLASRHAVLRTAFVWEGVDEPLQVVLKEAEVPWLELDWSHLPPSEQEEGFAAMLAEDRRQSFDVGRAPLMRLTLVRVAPDRHRLVWTTHHLLLDGWSMPLVFREVAQIYEALSRGAEPGPSLSRPYRDYIAWLARQDAEAAEEFWRRRLAGAQACRPFTRATAPAARPDENGLARFDVAVESLSAEETDALRESARAARVTLGTMVSAAWALVVAGLAGRDDVLYGVTVSGRPASLPGAERMVGLFINTLAGRVRVAWDEPAGEWLRRLQDEAAEARQYEYMPLSRVHAWAGAAGGELFDSTVVYENYPAGEDEREGVARALGVEASESSTRTHYAVTVGASARRELEVEVIEREGAASWVGGARVLAGRVCEVLRAMACVGGGESKRVRDLAEVRGEELRRLLHGWNDTAAGLPEECAHTLFERQAAKTPDAVAVVTGDGRVTYGELDERAGGVARRLRALGVGPESRVGVMLGRSAEAVTALLGVLKAGGVYVPLDPDYPRERLRFMLRDSGVSVLLTRRALCERAGEVGALRVLCVDEEGDADEAEGLNARTPSSSAVSPRNAAYVIYTSGSTGEPKGVVVEHSQLASRLRASSLAFGLGPGDALPCLASFSFDISLWELFWPLTCGACTLLGSARELLDGGADAGWMRGEATALHAVPGLMRRLAEGEGWGRIRQVFVGGEAVDAPLVALLRERFAGAGVEVFYGPTEATIICAHAAVGEGSEPRGGLVGRGFADTTLRVCDSRGALVAAGVVGELYVGGAGVARGYLNRPALTAERFVPDPHSPEPGARLYRTGDMVRHLADGHLEFMGRADGQVKVRGFRVETGEIESALLALASVKEAAVVAKEGEGGERRLVAYVVTDKAEGGAGLNVTELRSRLGERLPEYMIPSAFVRLDSLPLNSNEKLDRAALPEPGTQRPELAAAYEEPQMPIEQTLAGIWREVLKVERVGRGDNFFELGGHSLLAMLAVGRAREAFKVELPLRSLFEARTLRELAEEVERMQFEEAGGDELSELLGQLEEMGEGEARELLSE